MTPTLPENILKFQSLYYIRILRFLGGVSFLLILSKKYYNIYMLYICMFFALLFTIYHIIISYHRIKHIIKVLKSDELDIRNSPLDRLASLGAKAIMCAKGACEAAQPVGLGLGLMLGTDEIVKASGREAIFSPFLGKGLNYILPANNNNKNDYARLITKSLKELESNNEEIRTTESLINKFKDLNFKGDLSIEESKEFQTLLHENRETFITKNEEIKEKIKSILDEKFNK